MKKEQKVDSNDDEDGDDLVSPLSFGCQVALGVAGGEVLLAENQTIKMRQGGSFS